MQNSQANDAYLHNYEEIDRFPHSATTKVPEVKPSAIFFSFFTLLVVMITLFIKKKYFDYDNLRKPCSSYNKIKCVTYSGEETIILNKDILTYRMRINDSFCFQKPNRYYIHFDSKDGQRSQCVSSFYQNQADVLTCRRKSTYRFGPTMKNLTILAVESRPSCRFNQWNENQTDTLTS